ncbi:MAG: hypothetical protein H0V67_07265 [Geodermatophilaceae bacterium]|nr:hypothetical protein [Geodermatophilaceae bacterium]
MSPDLTAIVRSSTRVRPRVRASATSVRQLQASLRRLGADEAIIAAVAAANQTGTRAPR